MFPDTVVQGGVRRLQSRATILLLAAPFLLITACRSDSAADNSTEPIRVIASPTPNKSGPSTVIDPTAPSPNAVVISIPAEDDFYIGKEQIALDDLPQRVSELLKDKPVDQHNVYIKAASTVSYSVIDRIMALLRTSGIDRIGLVTSKRGDADSPEIQRKQVSQTGRRIIESLQQTDDVVIDVVAKSGFKQRVEVNSISLPLAELGATLTEILGPRNQKVVYIRVSSETLYGAVVRVVDVVKAAGASQVGIVR